MAEEKRKKNTAASRAAGKRSSGGARSRGKNKKSAAKPIRREVGAFVCLFLGVFTVLCCFQVDAVILNLMSALFKGLIGAGFYILPFSFLMGFVILLLHDGRPVALRVTCAFLLSATIGALVHLFAGSNAEWTADIFVDLWESGIAGTSGGVLAGLLAQALAAVISRIGAVILLLCRHKK